jgi:hypothetical protein
MMLTEDTPPKGNKKGITGSRTSADMYFKAIPKDPQKQLLNATVRLRPKIAPFNTASGVILTVVEDTAYVLTAKHVLCTLQGVSPQAVGGKKPTDFNPVAFGEQNYIEIGYAPATLLGEPTKTAPVTGVNFFNVIDSGTWDFDLVIFEATDADFVTHVKTYSFLNNIKTFSDYKTLLTVSGEEAEEEKKDQGKDEKQQPKAKANGKGSLALNTDLFEFLQLGYGTSITKDYIPLGVYKEYEGKIQCKESWPLGRTPIKAFEIDRSKKSDKWQSSEEICLMSANAAASTGQGDSGGPMFCRPKKVNKNIKYLANRDVFYLVGINTGANFFTDPKLKLNNAKLLSEKEIHNNAVTFWAKVFSGLEWPNA